MSKPLIMGYAPLCTLFAVATYDFGQVTHRYGFTIHITTCGNFVSYDFSNC